MTGVCMDLHVTPPPPPKHFLKSLVGRSHVIFFKSCILDIHIYIHRSPAALHCHKVVSDKEVMFELPLVIGAIYAQRR